MATERIKFWGPPGTGKTRKLMGIVADEIDRGVLPSEIIYTSFTKAACNEAMQRIVQDGRYHRADFPYFATEHAICFRLLQLHKDVVFADKRLQEFGDLYPIYRFSNTQTSFDERYEFMLQSLGDFYEFFISWMDNTMLPFDEAIKRFMKEHPDVPDGFTVNGARIYMERRDAFKQERGLWDFADMIHTVRQREMVPPGARVLVADEMQDASKSLWDLVEFWATKMERVYVAGDPFQAIYGFAGASPDLFESFNAELQVLPHSYRLTPQVKNYAENIIKVAGLSFPEFTVSDRQGSVAQDNLMSIQWDKLDSTFVLARTRRQLQDLATRLQLIGVPFVAERLRESPFNSSKSNAFYTLARLREHQTVNADDLRDLAHHTRRPWLVHGAKSKIQKLANADYQMKEIQHFFTQNFLDVLRDESFIDILCYNMEDIDRSYLGKVYRTGGLKAFMKAPSVTLTTIHGSKGRQADTVVLLPDIGRKAYEGFMLDKRSEVFVSYVAVTRAINQVVMLPRETAEAFPYPRRS